MDRPRIVRWRAVSSEEQAQRESLEYQHRLNVEHSEKWNGLIVADLIVPGMSRNIILWQDACHEIPAFAQLDVLIKRKAFDILMCQDVTRLGRDRALVVATARLCEQAGIRIYETTSPPSNLDGPITTSDTRLLMMLKGHMAEEEVRKTSERSTFGRQAQVRKGKHANTPPVGYKRLFNDKGEVYVVIDEEWSPHVKLFYELYINHGYSLRAIIKEFEARGIKRLRGKSNWDVTSVAGFLRNRWVYAGYSCWGQRSKTPEKGFRVKAEWEPIITEEMARRAEIEMKVRAKAPRAASHTRRFTLMAQCGVCGGRVSCHKIADGKRKEWQRGTTTNICFRQCAGSHIREPLMHAAIENEIARLTDAAYLESLLSETPSELVTLTSDIAQLEKRLEQIAEERANLTRAYMAKVITFDEYEPLMAEHKAVQDRVLQSLTELRTRAADTPSVDQQRNRLLEVREKGHEMLNHPDVKTANSWLRQHFRLIILANQVDIVQVF